LSASTPTLVSSYSNGAVGDANSERESYSHNDNDDLGLGSRSSTLNGNAASLAFVTPLRHDDTSTSSAHKPGIVTELMNRFSETASTYKRKRKHKYTNVSTETETETETPATDYNQSLNTNIATQEMERRRIRAFSTSSPQVQYQGIRRRKSHKPRKLITPKSVTPANLSTFRESTTSRRTDVHASALPPENSTIGNVTTSGTVLREPEGDSEVSNMSAFLNTDSESIFPPELEEKLLHDQDLHQKLADEINKVDGMSVSEPVIDDILSNILNNFDSNFEPRTHSQISPVFLRREKEQEQEFAVSNLDNRDDAQNQLELKTSKSADATKQFSKSKNASNRAKISEERDENENQDGNQNILPPDMDVEKFLDSIKYD